MPSDKLREQSGADSYLAEIRARKERKAQAAAKEETEETVHSLEPAKTAKPNASDTKRKPKLIITPPKKEARARDKHVKIKPSLDEKAMAKCKTQGISFNEAVNQLLEIWIYSEE